MITIELFEDAGALYAIERADGVTQINALAELEDDPAEHCPACDYPNAADYLRCACCGAAWSDQEPHA